MGRALRQHLVILILIALLFGTTFLRYNIQPIEADPRTWTVDDDGPADFHTINEALSASSPGDTIYVCSGVYNEDMFIQGSENLKIVGEDESTTIIEGAGRPVVRPILSVYGGTNFTFANFTVRNAGYGNEMNTAIRVDTVINATIADCIVSGSMYGIDVHYYDSWIGTRGLYCGDVISGNVVSDASAIAIGSLTYAINGVTVENNTITNSTQGICFINAVNVTVAGNNVQGNYGSGYYGAGILVEGEGSNNTIARNNVELWGAGIELEYRVDSNIVEENSVDSCNIGYFIGDESSDNIIIGNNATHNEIGFELVYSNGSLLENNFLAHNGYGMYLYATTGNKICHNDFVENDYWQVSTDGQPNIWDDGYPSGGNYWTGYSGSDADGDGIGDSPYVIDGANFDNYPLMTIYTPRHDIAAVNATVSRTITGEGYNMMLQAEMKNLGDSIENYYVTFYANSTTIGTLAVKQYARVSNLFLFNWNTTGFTKGWYQISANASNVESENFTDNNSILGDWILITVPGDVTGAGGIVDGKCDMRDIGVICTKFGATPNRADWDTNVDINGDGRIDMRDIGIACSNFGKHI